MLWTGKLSFRAASSKSEPPSHSLWFGRSRSARSRWTTVSAFAPLNMVRWRTLEYVAFISALDTSAGRSLSFAFGLSKAASFLNGTPLGDRNLNVVLLSEYLSAKAPPVPFALFSPCCRACTDLRMCAAPAGRRCRSASLAPRPRRARSPHRAASSDAARASARSSRFVSRRHSAGAAHPRPARPRRRR
jgi:hypothetical protein